MPKTSISMNSTIGHSRLLKNEVAQTGGIRADQGRQQPQPITAPKAMFFTT